MTPHDAATALAAAILPDLPHTHARFVRAYADHPAVAAYAAGTIDADEATRQIVQAAANALRAAGAVAAARRDEQAA